MNSDDDKNFFIYRGYISALLEILHAFTGNWYCTLLLLVLLLGNYVVIFVTDTTYESVDISNDYVMFVATF